MKADSAEVECQVEKTLKAIDEKFALDSFDCTNYCIRLIEESTNSELQAKVQKLQLTLDVVNFKLIQECTENSSRLLQALQQDDEIVEALHLMKNDLFEMLSALDEISCNQAANAAKTSKIQEEIEKCQWFLKNLNLWQRQKELEAAFITSIDLFSAYELYCGILEINHEIEVEKDTREMEKMLFTLFMQEIEQNLIVPCGERIEKLNEIFSLSSEELDQLMTAILYKILSLSCKIDSKSPVSCKNETTLPSQSASIGKLLENLHTIHNNFPSFISNYLLRKLVNEQIFGEYLLVRMENALNSNYKLVDSQIYHEIEQFKFLYEQHFIHPDDKFQAKITHCFNSYLSCIHSVAQNSIKESSLEDFSTILDEIQGTFSQLNSLIPSSWCMIDWEREISLSFLQLESFLAKEWSDLECDFFFSALESAFLLGNPKIATLKSLAFDKIMQKSEISREFSLVNWQSSGKMDRHHAYIDAICSNLSQFPSISLTPSKHSNLKQQFLEHICHCIMEFSANVPRFTHETRAILMLDLKVLSEYFGLPCPSIAESFVKSFYFSAEQMEEWILNNFDALSPKILHSALSTNYSLDERFIEKLKAFVKYKK